MKFEDRAKILTNVYEDELQRKESIRNQRFLFILGILLFIAGITLWVQTEPVAELFIYGAFDRNDRNDMQVATNLRWLGTFLFLFSTVPFSYLYMADFHPTSKGRRDNEQNANGIGSEDKLQIVTLLRSIDSSIEKGKLDSVLSESERDEIIRKITETVESQLNQSLLGEMEKKYGSTIVDNKLSSTAAKSMNSTVMRLKEYAENLQKKASINLAYGIFATITAIISLMYLLFNASPPEAATTLHTAFYFISRFFLVVLIQGIAIFFLKLYRSTLDSVLYLNNEVTNHESKRDSLVLALMGGDKETTSSIMLSLATTERNFKIKGTSNNPSELVI